MELCKSCCFLCLAAVAYDTALTCYPQSNLRSTAYDPTLRLGASLLGFVVILAAPHHAASRSLAIEHHYLFEKHVLSAVTVVSGRLAEEKRGKRGYDTFLTS